MNIELEKHIPIIRKKLKNGLDIAIINKPKAPIISINLAYKVGSKNEKDGIKGFAHLFEHLMFEGSQHVPKGTFDKYCSGAGGTNNAYTTYDYTAYTMTIPSNQLELALWMESDRMFYSDINSEALENQKKVVIEEIKQVVENQPYGTWRQNLAKSAFKPECSYSWEVHGSKENVADSTLELVKSFHNRFYRPNNACLVLSGNIDENSFELIEKYFGYEKDLIDIPRPNFENNFIQKETKISYKDNVPLAASFVAFHAGSIFEDSPLQSDILAYFMGVGKSSLLYNSIVYEKQLASQVGTFVDKREFCSLVTFYAIANNPDTKPEELTEAIFKEIELIKQKGFEDKLFEKSRNQIITQVAYEMQSAAGVADTVANQMLFWDDPFRIYSYLSKYETINNNHIKDLLNNNIKRENSVIIEIEPTQVIDN